MKRTTLLLFLLAALTYNDMFSQSRAELKSNFYDAESWILFEAYKDALPLYMQLLERYPDNANFKFRIGECFINISGDKEKAIRFLEEASMNIDPDYKEGKFEETGAPYDVLYYLANAYRINNQLDKAIETYNKFRKNLDSRIYDSTVVELQIQSCFNAKKLMAKPEFIRKNNLGDVINTSSSDYNPVMSDDEQMIVFSRSEPFYDAILYSVKENGKWSYPQNMNEILKVDRDLYPTSLSSDGKTLYLYSNADYDGMLYTSKFENDTWSPMIKLNDNINTKYWESHATVSHDNKKLYFTSNRKGTYGGLDIYVSQIDSTGDWGVAKNLGPVINSPFNEETPFLSKDDRTLYFSSRGHFNMGGYDIFCSTLGDNGEWSEPRNVGYPVNSTDDDLFFKPSGDKCRGFYSMDSPDGYGKEDIYQVEIFSDEHPRKFLVSGKASVIGLLSTYEDSIKLSVISIKKPGSSITAYTNPKTKEYSFNIPQGEYQVSFEGYGGEKITKKLDLPMDYPSDNYLYPEILLPRTDFTANLRVEGSRNITVTNGESIQIPLTVEPESVLKVEKWAGNSMVSTEKYNITTSVFNYKMVPERGDNRVIFRLTDRFNNTADDEVSVTRPMGREAKTMTESEYERIIAEKQTSAYLALLKNHSDDKLLRLITESGVEKEIFKNADDILSYLKTKAAAENMNGEVVDKAALMVASTDNVLTQPAIDLLAKYAGGELKNILTGLNIREAGLKTWSDLQRYIKEKGQGRVTPGDLQDLVEYILAETDPAIAVIRDKILIYGDNSKKGTELKESVNLTDKSNIKKSGKWLNTFYDESIGHGFTPEDLSRMFTVIGTSAGTKPDQLLDDLIRNSSEPLITALHSTDLKKEGIKTPDELLHFLLTARDTIAYPKVPVFTTVANLIASNNIPPDVIRSQMHAGKTGRLWILWIIAGASAIILFFIFVGRKRKEKK